MRKRRHLDDWDPTNPFHIHTEDGQKVVFTEEAYNKLPDDIKQQIDAHYKEMNTFENKYQTTEEYKDFLQKVANSRVADDVKTSIKEKYLDRNWLDDAWRKREYSFDDNGLLIHNGQTYAPFGDNTQQGIVVPLRDTSGRSYGHNVIYYPYNVPQQYTEITPELVDNTIDSNIIEQVTNAKREQYIKDNTRYFSPHFAQFAYDPSADTVIGFKEYVNERYPFRGQYKSDANTGAVLLGNAKNEPYLTEDEYYKGVRKVISANNKYVYDLMLADSSVGAGTSLNEAIRQYPDYFLNIKKYLQRNPSEYLNRKQPSEKEVLQNIHFTLEDLLAENEKTNKRKRSLKAGGIYIKPSHRGRFTALKERTGHSSIWFKQNGTPAQKKMATFALNAAKWKH